MHRQRSLHILLFTAALLCSFSTGAAAQQKIGYVNTDQILEQIPEYQGIQQKLSAIADGWRQELEEMQQKIDQLEEDFEAKEILYSDEVRAERQQEIEKLEQARQEFLREKFGQNGEYFQRQQELLEPIQRKVYEAVTSVAQRQNIDFVFDRAKNSSLLFGRKQWNLNKDVLQELGISLNQ